MTAEINIDRKMLDTKRITFELNGKKGSVRITSWTQFQLEVFAKDATTGVRTTQGTVTGALETTGVDGRLYFVPTGAIPRGSYFYEARAVDTNGELGTFAAGTYIVT